MQAADLEYSLVEALGEIGSNEAIDRLTHKPA
jgi:hypothetical protein